MNLLQITPENIFEEHICCAIGNDATNKTRAKTKKKWLTQAFTRGLVFRRLDERGKMFISQDGYCIKIS